MGGREAGLALARAKCQSNGVDHRISGGNLSLTYQPREVVLSDGTTLKHTSLGGDLESVWAGDLGDRYIEVVHLGAGPRGGELVLVDAAADTVVIGDLYTNELRAGDLGEGDTPPVDEQWPATIDLALGLLTDSTTVLTSSGTIDRDELEMFHQRLLGALHGA